MPFFPMRAADVEPSILATAAWFGLLTGLLEIALLGVKKFYLGQAVWFGRHVLWMGPAATIAAFLLAGALLLAGLRLGGRRGRSLPPSVAAAAFVFLSVLTLLLMYYPLALYARILLAAGAGVQAGRLVRRWPAPFARIPKLTMAPLAIVFAILAAAAFFPIASSADVSGRPAVAPGRPNVLLIVLDTVRAQSMGVYGYSRPTTPNLARRAATGIVFDGATATAPWTLPSHASMFTGRWPHEMSATLDQPLDSTHPTIAEILRDAGYRTGGFVANGFYCGSEFGLSRGFDHYEDYDASWRELVISSTLTRHVVNSRLVRRVVGYYDNIPRKRAAEITDAFLDWSAESGDRPFFAFLNYFDAHETYFPPRLFADAFGPERPRSNHLLIQDLRRTLRHDWPDRPRDEIQAEQDMYDAAIAYLDAELDRLFDALQTRGVLQNTVVIVTSDHGEQFGEHGLFLHGNSLYAPLLHVPLIVWLPGREDVGGRRVDARVSLRDIPATLMEVAGLDSAFPGASLARFWTSPAPAGVDAPVLSEVSRADWGRDWYPISSGDLISVMDDRFHFIWRSDGYEQLFDLDRDPGELRDLKDDPELQPTLQQLRAAAASARETHQRQR